MSCHVSYQSIVFVNVQFECYKPNMRMILGILVIGFVTILPPYLRVSARLVSANDEFSHQDKMADQDKIDEIIGEKEVKVKKDRVIDATGVRRCLRAESMESCGLNPSHVSKASPQFASYSISKASNKISNGEVAQYGFFPSYVLIKGYYMVGKRPVTSTCGGTIVGNRTILTAAHCFRMVDHINNISIIVGTNGPPSQQKSLKPMKLCHHESFCLRKLNDHTSFSINDVLVIIVKDFIEYSYYVQPACLPFGLNASFIGNDDDSYVTAGFGMKKRNPDQYPKRLMQTQMRRKCLFMSESIETSNNLTKGLLDCYISDSESAICRGDSGGPIYYNRRFENVERQFLAGLVSFGPSYCEPKKSFAFYSSIIKSELLIRDMMLETGCKSYVESSPKQIPNCAEKVL